MKQARKISVEPTSEPVTLQEAKNHLRVDSADEDALIGGLITAARRLVESHLSRQLVTATWTVKLDCFPGATGTIEMPIPPLQSVSSITYVDTAGTTQTLSASLYRVDAQGEPGRLTPAYAEVWPATRLVTGAVTITFVAGYGEPEAVPQSIKQAILLLVGHLYEHRNAVVIDQGVTALVVPMAVDALIAAEKWELH